MSLARRVASISPKVPIATRCQKKVEDSIAAIEGMSSFRRLCV